MIEGKILKTLAENMQLKLDFDEQTSRLTIMVVYKGKEMCSDYVDLPV